MDSDTEFAVFWEPKGRNTMGAKRLGEMHLDFASWSNLLAVLLGQSRYAEVTMRPSGSKPQRSKVMLAQDAPPEASTTTYKDIH